MKKLLFLVIFFKYQGSYMSGYMIYDANRLFVARNYLRVRPIFNDVFFSGERGISNEFFPAFNTFF